ncbi:hypothetical protein B0A52_00866 [Exophiala mesophila]|uniref:Ecp2 effector protein domain-containing protein n=1 Tax=Exophiala mesophila TaxID=212818 RepID=A0A438NIG5_EXOME|nr:hypothetical protein B0A52_00866 [Exophiala mesophila]
MWLTTSLVLLLPYIAAARLVPTEPIDPSNKDGSVAISYDTIDIDLEGNGGWAANCISYLYYGESTRDDGSVRQCYSAATFCDKLSNEDGYALIGNSAFQTRLASVNRAPMRTDSRDDNWWICNPPGTLWLPFGISCNIDNP